MSVTVDGLRPFYSQFRGVINTAFAKPGSGDTIPGFRKLANRLYIPIPTGRRELDNIHRVILGREGEAYSLSRDCSSRAQHLFQAAFDIIEHLLDHCPALVVELQRKLSGPHALANLVHDVYQQLCEVPNKILFGKTTANFPVDTCEAIGRILSGSPTSG